MLHMNGKERAPAAGLLLSPRGPQGTHVSQGPSSASVPVLLLFRCSFLNSERSDRSSWETALMARQAAVMAVRSWGWGPGARGLFLKYYRGPWGLPHTPGTVPCPLPSGRSSGGRSGVATFARVPEVVMDVVTSGPWGAGCRSALATPFTGWCSAGAAGEGVHGRVAESTGQTAQCPASKTAAGPSTSRGSQGVGEPCESSPVCYRAQAQRLGTTRWTLRCCRNYQL